MSTVGHPGTPLGATPDAGIARPGLAHLESRRYEPEQRLSRPLGVAAVLLVHLVVGWTLYDALEHPPAPPPTVAREPMLLQRVTLPPPAPPPEPPPPPPTPLPPPPKAVALPKPAPPPPKPVAAPPPPAAAPRAEPLVPMPAVAPAPSPAPVPAPAPAAPAAPPTAPTPPAAPSPAPAVAAPLTAPPRASQPAMRADMGVACPRQVAPDMPRRALQEGISGVVRAQALIRNGAVVEVTILSGPRIYHAAVRAAMLQYRCVSDASEVLATQEFAFKID